MAEKATLYQDTVTKLLADAEASGEQNFDLTTINKAIAERAKKVTRWKEEETGKGG